MNIDAAAKYVREMNRTNNPTLTQLRKGTLPAIVGAIAACDADPSSRAARLTIRCLAATGGNVTGRRLGVMLSETITVAARRRKLCEALITHPEDDIRLRGDDDLDDTLVHHVGRAGTVNAVELWTILDWVDHNHGRRPASHIDGDEITTLYYTTIEGLYYVAD